MRVGKIKGKTGGDPLAVGKYDKPGRETDSAFQAWISKMEGVGT